MTGLVMGRFLPLHAGHRYLIDSALATGVQLTVIIVVRAEDAISGDVRQSWLNEIYPGVTVLQLHDCVTPVTTYAVTDAWVKNTRTVYPSGPDILFSSEYKNDDFALHLGARHILLDPDRKTVPISGTRIRANLLDGWNNLPIPVQRYYCKAVQLITVGCEMNEVRIAKMQVEIAAYCNLGSDSLNPIGFRQPVSVPACMLEHITPPYIENWLDISNAHLYAIIGTKSDLTVGASSASVIERSISVVNPEALTGLFPLELVSGIDIVTALFGTWSL